jgi:hypothetical protein
MRTFVFYGWMSNRGDRLLISVILQKMADSARSGLVK